MHGFISSLSSTLASTRIRIKFIEPGYNNSYSIRPHFSQLIMHLYGLLLRILTMIGYGSAVSPVCGLSGGNQGFQSPTPFFTSPLTTPRNTPRSTPISCRIPIDDADYVAILQSLLQSGGSDDQPPPEVSGRLLGYGAAAIREKAISSMNYRSTVAAAAGGHHGLLGVAAGGDGVPAGGHVANVSCHNLSTAGFGGSIQAALLQGHLSHAHDAQINAGLVVLRGLDHHSRMMSESGTQVDSSSHGSVQCAQPDSTTSDLGGDLKR